MKKEYLVKTIEDTYVYFDRKPETGMTYIEVPEGAVRLTIDSSKTMTFWKNNLESMNVGQDKKWVSAIKDEVLTFPQYSEYDYDVLWSSHTQPEELPFLDDEPVEPVDSTPHPHYFKDVSDIDSIDVYEVLLRFGVTDPCLQHIVKKALCTGNRGHKSLKTDMKDIHDTAVRMLAMHGIS